MTNEKHINSWKDRLDDLCTLPGDDVGGLETSWEKLGARLQAKERKHSYRWYWAAAALLLCITVSLLIKDKTDTTTPAIVNSSKRMIEKDQPAPAHSPSPVVTTASKMPIPARKVKPLPTHYSGIPVSIPGKKDSIVPDPLPVETAVLVEEVRVPEILKERPVVFTSLKKKLPVVHLNELEKPIPANEAVAGSGNRPPSRIRLFKRNVSPASPIQHESGNNIITIKLPPLN